MSFPWHWASVFSERESDKFRFPRTQKELMHLTGKELAFDWRRCPWCAYVADFCSKCDITDGPWVNMGKTPPLTKSPRRQSHIKSPEQGQSWSFPYSFTQSLVSIPKHCQIQIQACCQASIWPFCGTQWRLCPPGHSSHPWSPGSLLLWPLPQTALWPLHTHCSLPLASHPPHVSTYCRHTIDPQLHPASASLLSPAFPTVPHCTPWRHLATSLPHFSARSFWISILSMDCPRRGCQAWEAPSPYLITNRLHSPSSYLLPSPPLLLTWCLLLSPWLSTVVSTQGLLFSSVCP